MRISVAFTGMTPIAATISAVDAAERYGLDGVWTAEHIGFHDAVVPATVYLSRTERLEVGLVGFSSASRHPGLLTMELVSLGELFPGRVRVAVGTGDPSLIAKLGASIEKPARSSAALVHCLREALAGREMNVAHPGYEFRGFRVAPVDGAPPVDLMAIRPLMLKTAAEVADGVSLSAGGSKQYLRETVVSVEKELVAGGRQRTSFRITALAFCIIANDVDSVREQIKPIMAMAEPSMAEHLARGVLQPGTLVEAAKRGGPFAVAKALTPEVIDAIALVSTPDGLQDALAAYAETGIDELAVVFFAPPETQPELVRLVAEAR